MKPCPTCGPLHDLDCVTCTRCGWVEELPENGQAVKDAMVRGRRSIRGCELLVRPPQAWHSEAVYALRELIDALEGK